MGEKQLCGALGKEKEGEKRKEEQPEGKDRDGQGREEKEVLCLIFSLSLFYHEPASLAILKRLH